jgi:hypothetical protein
MATHGPADEVEKAIALVERRLEDAADAAAEAGEHERQHAAETLVFIEDVIDACRLRSADRRRREARERFRRIDDAIHRAAAPLDARVLDPLRILATDIRHGFAEPPSE